MISLVDAKELEYVLRPTVYRPFDERDHGADESRRSDEERTLDRGSFPRRTEERSASAQPTTR
jgi:hypothetical protein